MHCGDLNGKEIQKRGDGTSLVVQRVRLHAPNAGGLVQSLVGELDPTTKSLHATTKRSRMPQPRPGAA